MKKQLGDVELELLTIVWNLKEASVNDVLFELQKKKKVAYTTVMTMLQNLAKKEVLAFRKEGRSYIYSAKIAPDQIKQSLLSKLMGSVFSGSKVEMVQFMMEHEPLSQDEKEEIKRMVDKL